MTFSVQLRYIHK